MNLDTNLDLPQKLKYKTMKPLEENIGENLYDSVFDEEDFGFVCSFVLILHENHNLFKKKKII